MSGKIETGSYTIRLKTKEGYRMSTVTVTFNPQCPSQPLVNVTSEDNLVVIKTWHQIENGRWELTVSVAPEENNEDEE